MISIIHLKLLDAHVFDETFIDLENHELLLNSFESQPIKVQLYRTLF